MVTLAQQVLVAVVTTVVVGTLVGGEWPYFVIGALLALSLWVMLFADSFARPRRAHVDSIQYAVAAAVGLGLGYVMTLVGGGENAVWWAVGFIFAGVIIPAGRGEQRSERADGDA